MKFKKSRRNLLKGNNKGFTLVELIVVIVILAILVGVTLGGISSYVKKAKLNTDIANVKTIYDTMQVLLVDSELTKLALQDAKRSPAYGYQQYLEGKIQASSVGGYMLVYKKNIPSIKQDYFWFENTDTFIDRSWVQGAGNLGSWGGHYYKSTPALNKIAELFPSGFTSIKSDDMTCFVAIYSTGLVDRPLGICVGLVPDKYSTYDGKWYNSSIGDFIFRATKYGKVWNSIIN